MAKKLKGKLVDQLGAGQNRLTPRNDLSGSRFRKRYRQLSNSEVAWNDAIKDTAAQLEILIEALGPSHYGTLAMDDLERSVMYAVKELTGKYPVNPKTKDNYTTAEIDKLLRRAKRAKAD